MSRYEDPVVERYDDALQRIRDLEVRADSDPTVRLVTVIGEVRAIRDDILAERRDRISKDKDFAEAIDRLHDGKQDKNPNRARTYWLLLAGAVSAVFSIIVWLVEGAK